MTQYWAFARGGAWRNPKPTGGPYICEQCRPDARSGNDSTLTLQAVTAIELALWTYAATAGRGCWRKRRAKIEANGIIRGFFNGTRALWPRQTMSSPGRVFLDPPASLKTKDDLVCAWCTGETF